MSIQEIRIQGGREAANKHFIDTYNTIKDTDEWKSRSKTQHLYMMCIALNVSQPVVQQMAKETGIEL